MAVKQYQATIEKIENLSETVRHFIINLGESMEFKAGQFINLSFEQDGQTYRKPYSLASDPKLAKEQNKIELCIKLVDTGTLTPHLWHKKENEKVNIMGPLGLFTLQENQQEQNMVFIGTGTGIAPLRAMIKEEIEKQNQFHNETENIESENVTQNKNLILILGVRFENEILYKEEFEKLEKENPNFKFVPIVSRPTDTWQARKGHVQDNLEFIDIGSSQFYMCGLPAMVEAVKEKLLQSGAQETQIHHEIYK